MLYRSTGSGTARTGADIEHTTPSIPARSPSSEEDRGADRKTELVEKILSVPCSPFACKVHAEFIGNTFIRLKGAHDNIILERDPQKKELVYRYRLQTKK